jgi:hypothetical protein
MSKEFGLDWKEYEYDRMIGMMTAMAEIGKKHNKDIKKQKNKFRPRM